VRATGRTHGRHPGRCRQWQEMQSAEWWWEVAGAGVGRDPGRWQDGRSAAAAGRQCNENADK